MSDAAFALRQQFLAWLAERPRTYKEVMEGWRSSCPRLTIWEDALSDELISFDDSSGATIVMPTAKGRELIGQVEDLARRVSCL